MPLIDLVLIIVVIAFAGSGIVFGFMKTLGTLLGSVIGLLVANWAIVPVTEKIGFVFGGGWVATLVVFILIFMLVSKLLGLVFDVLGKVTGIVKVIPFAKTVDRLLGGLFGFVEGVIVLGMVLYFAAFYLPDTVIAKWVGASSVAGYLVSAMDQIQDVFPEGISLTKPVVPPAALDEAASDAASEPVE